MKVLFAYSILYLPNPDMAPVILPDIKLMRPEAVMLTLGSLTTPAGSLTVLEPAVIFASPVA
jgi:hypothetical protein